MAIPAVHARSGPPRRPARSIVLIGDAICQGYMAHVGALAERAPLKLTRVQAATSRSLLADDQVWEAVAGADLVHVNVGLRDLKFDCRTREHAVNLDAYAANVREILERLRASVAAVVWATTTPVIDARRGVAGHPGNAEFIRRNDDVRAFNTAAVDAARAAGVPRDDLYMAIVAAGAHRLIGPDGVHLIDAGYQICAGQVADVIKRMAPV